MMDRIGYDRMITIYSWDAFVGGHKARIMFTICLERVVYQWVDRKQILYPSNDFQPLFEPFSHQYLSSK